MKEFAWLLEVPDNAGDTHSGAVRAASRHAA